MIGNDVVDLLDEDTDPARPRARFDARVMTPAERREIATAIDPSAERWAHWAAKEAAYKLMRKRAPATVFSPVRFEADLAPCPATEVRSGTVQHPTGRVAIEVVLEAGAVHALAEWPGEGATERLTGLVRLAPDDPRADSPRGHSRAVRELALGRLAGALSVSIHRLSIEKRERIPHLMLDGRSIPVDLSLSHHGRVVAFACRLDEMALRRAS